MPKKSIIWLKMMLSIVLLLLAACGTNNSTTSPGSVATVPAGENLYVLDGYTPLGAAGTRSQQIVAFHPDSANPSTLVTLPAGLTSSDHQKLYIASAKNGQTTITILNTQTGATIRSLTIPGTYSTIGQDFAHAVLSYNGQWLVLQQFEQVSNETSIALIDTQAGKVAKTIHLTGNFDLDAVSPGGQNLYLLERVNDPAHHYYVRLYQVDQNQLYPNPIVDKTEINNPRMTGIAVTRQMSSDGTTAYTLYIDTYHNWAFVHVLPLDGASLPFARCVDLPAGKASDLLHYYTLSLSSDGNTLYAANGALGVVSAISLKGDDVFDDKVEATAHFNSGNTSMSAADKTRMFHNGAVLSPDQKTLYFAGIRGVWAVNVDEILAQKSSLIQGNYLANQAFTGIALSADGRTLYAVDPTQGITLLNSSTGQTLQVISGPAHTPWGIEWIAN